MYYIIASGALSIFFAIMLMAYRFKQKPMKCLVFKALASLFFVMTALFAFWQNKTSSPYGMLIVAGAILGLLGDLFLQIKSFVPEFFKKIVVMGMTLFAIGHFLYFGAIMTATKITPYPFVIAVLFAIFAWVMLSTKRFEGMGRVKPVGIAYYYVLSATMLQGLFSAIMVEGVFATLFLIGSIFFFISDTLLALMYFGGLKGRWTTILNLSTYYLAQLFITVSIFFFI